MGRRRRAGLTRDVPDLVTIWRVLTAVDAAALDPALGCWVTARLAARPGTRHPAGASGGRQDPARVPERAIELPALRRSPLPSSSYVFTRFRPPPHLP